MGCICLRATIVALALRVEAALHAADALRVGVLGAVGVAATFRGAIVAASLHVAILAGLLSSLLSALPAALRVAVGVAVLGAALGALLAAVAGGRDVSLIQAYRNYI